MIAVTVFGGFLLTWALFYLSEKAVVGLLDRYQVYAHVDAYVFWLIYAVLVERLLEPMLVGFIVARAAKGLEMISTITLSLICGGISGIFLIREIRYLGWSTPNAFSVVFEPLILSTFVSPALLIIGGVVARKGNLPRHPSISHC